MSFFLLSNFNINDDYVKILKSHPDVKKIIYIYSISPIFHVVHSIPLSPWEEATYREGRRNGWEEGDKQDEEGEDREGARREVREGRREKGEGG